MTVEEIPMAHGFAFTAIRSGTGIGFEVSSRGGSLTGKNTSWMLSQRPAQMGFSSKAFPRNASSSWPVPGQPRLPGRSFLPVSCVRSFAFAAGGPAVAALPARDAGSREQAHRSIMLDRARACLGSPSLT